MSPIRRREPKHDSICTDARYNDGATFKHQEVGLNRIKVTQLSFGKIVQDSQKEVVSCKPEDIIVIKKRGMHKREIIVGGGNDESEKNRIRDAEEVAMRVQIQTSIDRLFGDKPLVGTSRRERKYNIKRKTNKRSYTETKKRFG